MAASVTLFDPQPRADELPARMPSPFTEQTPHPLAVRAAAELRAELAGGLGARLALARDGKMFGVLVVVDGDGRVGFLRAFSGMVDRRWELDGFAPPAFDQRARDAFWIDGERGLDALASRMQGLADELAPLRAELDALLARHHDETRALRERHRAARAERHAARAATTDAAALAALDRASARHTDERRTVERRQRDERSRLAEPIAERERARAALDAERAARSRELLVRIHETYVLPDARGDVRRLRELFAPHEPPGGAGDCAAPKLLAHAYRHGLRPVALAEMWCGAAPATGGRRDGHYYPACRGKCGPVLAHMLGGLAVEPAPAYGEGPIDPDAPATVYEDRWLVVLAKPAGLLSVPGRSSRADSVLARLRRRYPEASGPLLVHRLDLDTSGLMLAAKDAVTHGALQRQFEERTIDKRYVAWLDGDVAADRGEVDLPLRVDLDDRPRQLVDPVHGKPAYTRWEVIGRSGEGEAARTRVALHPRTGRAHQLRVHAAHPRGIGVPIVGDRLYGRAGDHPGARLLLHAEAIAFVHPHTHERMQFTDPAPF